MAGALSHLRVVELCDDIPGAACARQFAQWGADVLVVEPPEGSPLRRLAPLIPDCNGEPVSLLWEYLGANKRSAVVDLGEETERQRLCAHVQGADLFITDRPPDWLAGAGLDYATLGERAPGLAMLSVTPFGSDGPYAGYIASDLVVQALSGMLSLSGEPERMPLKMAANVLPQACGISAFIGALAALHERERSGRGQLVEVATMEAVASLVLFLRAQYMGAPFPRRSGVGTALLACRDGYLLCNPRAFRNWDDLLIGLDVPKDAVPDSLRTPEGRQGADTGTIIRFLEAHTRPRVAQELFLALGSLGIVCSVMRTPAQLLDDEHLRARGYFRTIDHPRLGPLTSPGPAARLSTTPAGVPVPAPVLGPRLEAGPPGGLHPGRRHRNEEHARAPLADIRVLDLTTAWIGPYAGMLLADLGADVMKVEGPERPDTWRFFHAPSGAGLPAPPVAQPGAHPGNTRFYYNAVNRNKRGIALDLASARGKQIFLELVRSADLLLENFTPRVLENFGLGYDVLRQVNPRLILVSFSGYGRTGPYRDIKATGATIETIGGWVSLFGYPDEPPMLMGEMEADPISGLQAASAALIALAHRDATGQAQSADGSMFEAAVGYIGEEILLAGSGDDRPHPRGNRDRGRTQGVFPSLGTDSWLALTVRGDDDWRALLGVATDAPWLHDPCFESAADRLACMEQLEEKLAQWTARHEAHELMTALQRAGVPAGVVLRTDQVPQDPHVVARGWFRPLTHPDTGTQLHNGHPWRFSRSPLVWRSASPRLGQHSAEVLREELRLSEDEIAGLFAQGIVRQVDEWSADETAPA